MSDVFAFLQWYGLLFVIGIVMLPITAKIFSAFVDKGYIFSKIIGALIISYGIFLFSTLKLLPFDVISLLLLGIALLAFNIYLLKTNILASFSKSTLKIIVLEEILFLLALIFWTYIRGHEPSINGLEKFMDFGFINSILRTEFFPPIDIWFPPHPINYYYFGHLVTAVLTKLSFLPSHYTYNLMVATIFSFSVMASFSIGLNVTGHFIKSKTRSVIGGILAGLLVGVAGNLHVIYAFFEAYVPAESPVPFWQLAFKPLEIFTTNGYWYPNATRFIPNTIHEFPIYSSVVSDLHGHVLDIPVVLVLLALLLQIILVKKITIPYAVCVGFILAVMYMTNVLDFGIYLLVTTATIGVLVLQKSKQETVKSKKSRNYNSNTISTNIIKIVKWLGLIFVSAAFFSLPFSFHFKPFTSGIGILCGYEIINPLMNFFQLENNMSEIKMGPFLFEPDHCQRSEWWMLLTLYGFFYFFVITFLVFFWKNVKKRANPSILYAGILISLSILFIIIPEFAYIKDIYPDHYRANTMFKLTYQSFIMLSIVSAFVIAAIIIPKRNIILSGTTIVLLALVLLYPKFAIYSYYNSLKEYSGIDGTQYLQEKLPSDYRAIQWINQNITGQPILLEAQGESYTDYARISANTGLPTVLGWTVHEWLWRGSYDVPAPRVSDVHTLYETTDLQTARELIEEYSIDYVYIGNLEKEKYPNLSENKFASLGKEIYSEGDVRIYKIIRSQQL